MSIDDELLDGMDQVSIVYIKNDFSVYMHLQISRIMLLSWKQH